MADAEYKKPVGICERNASTINFNAVYTTRSRSAGERRIALAGTTLLGAGVAVVVALFI